MGKIRLLTDNSRGFIMGVSYGAEAGYARINQMIEMAVTIFNVDCDKTYSLNHWKMVTIT